MTQPIAIVGMAARFPGAPDLDAYWRLLLGGVDAVTEVPPDRWDVDAVYSADPAAPGKANTRWGGFLEAIDRFDAAFFRISPREAVQMDPQQRLMLELAWEAIEDAGVASERLRGSQTGVFVGSALGDYARLIGARPDLYGQHSITGQDVTAIAARVSYTLDLHGPSLVVNTACSSSLVAIHLACQSLRLGESTLALAGGVNLMVGPESTILMTKFGALSPGGRSRAFDARADGYVRAEGGGLLVLKPLADACRDGDRVYCLIRASAANNDGLSSGLAAPNEAAQADALRRAYAAAGVDPARVQYVEAHGTGTRVGDPIEARSLGAVVGAAHGRGQPLLIGSVKTNIGHAEAAAGAAGAIKTALMLRHRTVVPSLHFEQPNPAIPFEGLGLRVVDRAGPWPEHDGPALAGVNSFGFGGTNCHVVLEEAPAEPTVDRPPPGDRLVPLSAHTPEALRQLAQRTARVLGEPADVDVYDVAATAALRRTHHHHRLAVVAGTLAELRAELEAFGAGAGTAGATERWARGRPKLVFVFPGQGAQWVGMGRELAASEPPFRAALEACEAAMRPHVDWSLREVLTADESAGWLGRIDVVQPALFALQVALAAQWRAWGVEPDGVVGHSMGEVAAAHVAGALDLADAARVICRRSRLLRRASGRGAMAAVELSADETRAALAGRAERLALAVWNGPRASVISGDPAALDEVLAELESREVFCRRVNVDVASHSPQMDGLRDDLLACLDGLAPGPTRLPLYSTVAGRTIEGRALGPSYWVDNLRQPVLFGPAVEQLLGDGFSAFVELSPHPLLTQSVAQWLRHAERPGLAVPSLRRAAGDRAALLGAAGALYAAGWPLDWSALYPRRGRQVAFPRYPFQRERFWFEAGRAPTPPGSAHPLLGAPLASPLGDRQWEARLRADAPAYLADHRVGGRPVMPLAGYAEMAVTAARASGIGRPELLDVVLGQPLELPGDDERIVRSVLTPDPDGASSLRIYSAPAGDPHGWIQHLSARLGAARDDRPTDWLAEARTRCREELSVEGFYQTVHGLGLDYGAAFRGIEQLWRGADEALGRVRLPACADRGPYWLHPALLDACLQVALAARPEHDALHMPLGLRRLVVEGEHADPTQPVWAWASLRGRTTAGAVVDVALLDQDGRSIVRLEGLEARRAEATPGGSPDGRQWLYRVAWQPVPAAPPVAAPPARWLLLVDRAGVGAALAERLRAAGHSAVLVEHGGRGEPPMGDSAVLDPSDAAAFRSLLASETRTRDGAPPLGGVVHLWSLDADTPPEDDPGAAEALAGSHLLGCGSFLHLVQAMASVEPGRAARLWAVTRGAQPVSGDEPPLAAAQAPVWGLAKVVAGEHPELRCTRVDLDPTADRLDSARQLLDELLAGAGPDPNDQLAFRGGVRRAARLTRARLAAPDAGLDPPPIVRGDATYLITGGLGALGLHVARWLVGRGARHLALVGRRGAAELPVATAAAVAELERSGAQVRLISADVARRRDVEGALGQVAAELPPLRGIVHAAGVLDDAIVTRQSWPRFAHVMAAKSIGAWHLHALTAGLPLDFFVLFSSMASMIGWSGQGNYASANSFLDALAHRRRALGRPALAVNWGAWAGAGMVAGVRTSIQQHWSARGLRFIPPTQGVELLEAALRAGDTTGAQIGVIWVDWSALLVDSAAARWPFWSALVDEARERRSRRSPVAPAGPTDRPVALEGLLAASPAARRHQLEDLVREQVGRVLGLGPGRPVEPDRGFAELGFDSLMSVELRNRLQTLLGRVLPLTVAFDHPTVDALRDFLLGELGGQAAPVDAAASAIEAVEALSDAEVERRLAEQLGAAGG